MRHYGGRDYVVDCDGGAAVINSSVGCPNLHLFDEHLIADLGVAGLDCADWEFDDGVRFAVEFGHAPRADIVHQCDHTKLLVEEDDVDRVSHAEHVDLVAWFDPQPFARLERRRPEEPTEAREEVICGAHAFGNGGCACDVGETLGFVGFRQVGSLVACGDCRDEW